MLNLSRQAIHHLRAPRHYFAEDYAQAVAYGAAATWAIIFILFPPISAVQGIDEVSRVGWLSLTAFFSLVAIFGVIIKSEYRVELVGLIFMQVGPFFYGFTQIYYALDPSLTVKPGLPIPDPSQRYALIAFCAYTTLLALPKILRILRERRFAKNAVVTHDAISSHLTPEQAAEPGAFPDLDARGVSLDARNTDRGT